MAVGEVDAVVAVPGRVDVPGGPVAVATHGGVEAHGREVEADGGGRVGDRATGVGGQLGVAGGEAVLHHGDLLHAEVDELAVGRGDGHDGPGVVGAGGLLGGSPVEGCTDPGAVEGEGGVARGLHPPRGVAPVTSGASVGGGPVAVVGWSGTSGEGQGLQAREGDDGRDEQGQVTHGTGHADPRISRRDGGLKTRRFGGGVSAPSRGWTPPSAASGTRACDDNFSPSDEFALLPLSHLATGHDGRKDER